MTLHRAIHRLPLTSALCIAAQSVALPAHAENTWSGTIGLVTDYIYRGLSQTHGEPAAQGGLQWQTPAGWSAGLWASTVDFNARGSAYEIDLQVARAWSLGTNWTAQLGAVHREYPKDTRIEYDYDELTASLSFQQRVTASASWSPNVSRYGSVSRYGERTLAERRHAISYELTLLQPAGEYWSLCAGAGHYDLRDLFGTGYWFWNAGVVFNWGDVQIDLLHIDTDSTARRLFGDAVSGRRWTAALTWQF